MRQPRTRLPLRVAIPVATGLLALVVTLISVGFNLQYSLAHSEEQSRELLTQLMNRVVADVEADNRFGGMRHQENQLRHMTRYRDVQQAVVFDPANRIAHSSNYILLGQTLDESGFSSMRVRMDEVRSTRRPVITRSGSELIGLAPITWKLKEGELLASEAGVAIIRYDRSRAITGHLNNAITNAGLLALAILFAAGATAWYFGRALTESVQHIVDRTRALSRREQTDALPSRIAEFGEISDALNAAQSALSEQILSLQLSEERFRDIVESSDRWIFESDIDWRITYSNQAAEDTLGYRPEQVIGICLKDLLLPDEENLRLFNSISEGARFSDVLLEIYDAQGGIRKIQISGSRRETPSPLMRCVAHDRTEQMHMEDVLLQSQKMDAVGQLAGGIAHDFNNILMVVLSRCELAMLETLNESTRTHLSSIREQALAASQVTRRMMTVARSGVNAPKVTQVNDVISQSLDLLTAAAAERVKIHLELAANLGLVKIDQTQLQQLLLNLVLNARHAMPEGGDIFIRTFMQSRRGSSVEEVCINFSDTGCGIDPAIIDRIFEPFFTTRKSGEGMGLGLASVSTSVRAAGGEINVDSRPQAGTTFRIRLPQAAGQVQDANWDREHEPVGRGERVLLVEDSEPLLRILGDYLESVGFDVIRAAGLAEARVELAAAPKDIIVTDIVLQDGMGTDLVPDAGSTPILFMSGYTKPEVTRNVVLEEGQNFLHKPFSPSELGQLVEHILASNAKEKYA